MTTPHRISSTIGRGKVLQDAGSKAQSLQVHDSQEPSGGLGSDFDTPDKPHRIAVATNLDLPFTRGYVHLEHAHYNARKDGHVTGVQTFRWDNVGFDGPTYAVPKSYEIVDNDKPDIDGVGGRLYGYYLTDQPTRCRSRVSTPPGRRRRRSRSPSWSPWRGRFSSASTATLLPLAPDYGKQAAQSDSALRGFAMDVPLNEIVNGDNTVAIKITGPVTYSPDVVGNMELSLRPPSDTLVGAARCVGARGERLLGRAAVTSPALTGPSQEEGTRGPPSVAAEVRRQLAALSPAKLPPPPADVTNRFADDARAAKLGKKLFFDPRILRSVARRRQ